MKTNIFAETAVITIGAALLCAATSVRSDEPKKQRHADNSGVAKAGRSGKIATIDGRHSTNVDGGLAGGANGAETRVPTGSHIPQTYHRLGYTTDRPDNLFIIDQNDQRLQSATNVSDSLRSVPGLTVNGRR